MASPTLSRHAVSARLGSSFRLPFLTVCLLAFLCFVWLAMQANGGHSTSFDSAIRTAVHGQASPLGTEFMLYATQLGAVVALCFLSAGVILGFLFLRLKRAAALMSANMVGAGLLNDGLKAFFHRLRPEPFLSIGKYASYYRLPLLRRVGGQYRERETLPYRNCRFHVNFSYPTEATRCPL